MMLDNRQRRLIGMIDVVDCAVDEGYELNSNEGRSSSPECVCWPRRVDRCAAQSFTARRPGVSS
jgi:hypothetical protein